MDECDNVLNVETYAAVGAVTTIELYEIEKKINDNDVAFMQVKDIYSDEEKEEEEEEDDDAENMGQAESKRNAKKSGGVGGSNCIVSGAGTLETKGTAMSFGFRKKLNTTPKKFKKLIEFDATKKKQQQQQQSQKVDFKSHNINHNEIVMEKSKAINAQTQDSNGNKAEQPISINFQKVSAAAAVRAAASPVNLEHTHHEYQPREATRFGFRGVNALRPASTGPMTSRFSAAECRENIENNNSTLDSPNSGGLVSNLKRRSKSAHASRNAKTNDETATPKITQPKSITFNLNQNSTIEYQRQQYFQQSMAAPMPISPQTVQTQATQYKRPNIIQSGIHTNVIVCPTPRAQSVSPYSKFTLQTVNLPKPEFAVPISVNASTPTTPGQTVFNPVVSTVGPRPHHPLTMVHTQHQYIDAKQAKQLVNHTRKGGFSGSREISADSGISIMDMAVENTSGTHGSPKRSRSRPRSLQMVMNGRHKFEVRDLVEPLSSGSSIVAPLTLPKLPMDSQTTPLPLNGLVRSNTILTREASEYACSHTLQMNLGKSKI